MYSRQELVLFHFIQQLTVYSNSDINIFVDEEESQVTLTRSKDDVFII